MGKLFRSVSGLRAPRGPAARTKALRFAPLVATASIGIPDTLYFDGRIGIYLACSLNRFRLRVFDPAGSI
jgi:hypothetical protein